MKRNTDNKRKFSDGDFKTARACDLGQPAPQCVQVARAGETIAVRSSKTGAKRTLTFDKDEWATFVQGVKNGEFDV